MAGNFATKKTKQNKTKQNKKNKQTKKKKKKKKTTKNKNKNKTKKKNKKKKNDDLPHQMTIFNIVVPIMMHFFDFFSLELSYFAPKARTASCVKPDTSQ